jgi:hypothetical protein
MNAGHVKVGSLSGFGCLRATESAIADVSLSARPVMTYIRGALRSRLGCRLGQPKVLHDSCTIRANFLEPALLSDLEWWS